MKSLLFRIAAVFVAVVSVTLMGAALSVYFVHPDTPSEINTPAMLNYSFEQTTGENPAWTVKRRFSIDPAAPSRTRPGRDVQNVVRSDHQRLMKIWRLRMGRQKNENVSAKGVIDQQMTLFDASQKQDVEAIADRAASLKAEV